MHSNQLSLGYWTLGAQFLRLAHESCSEIVNSGNKHLVASNVPMPSDQYDQATRWSDHSVGTAVLFNFFHGIELILKGFLSAKGVLKQHHRLTELLEDFEVSFPDTDLAREIWNALPAPCTCTPISRFLDSNSIEIDNWYEALKYPESRGRKQFSHIDLKYGGSTTIPFWNDIRELSLEIRVRAVALSRSQGYA